MVDEGTLVARFVVTCYPMLPRFKQYYRYVTIEKLCCRVILDGQVTGELPLPPRPPLSEVACSFPGDENSIFQTIISCSKRHTIKIYLFSNSSAWDLICAFYPCAPTSLKFCFYTTLKEPARYSNLGRSNHEIICFRKEKKACGAPLFNFQSADALVGWFQRGGVLHLALHFTVLVYVLSSASELRLFFSYSAVVGAELVGLV